MRMKVTEYAATTEKNWELNLMDMGEYKRKFTFYSDLSIAEYCEVYYHEEGAILDTHKRVMGAFIKDIKAMTEYVMVLNHKIWSFYGNVDSKYLECSDEQKDAFQKLYTKLFDEARAAVEKEYRHNKEALAYYYATLD